ncbi:hypothetical protein RJ640_018893 [Escallonia rubra]|uniref:Uncharacterized protein n=1 Tax=Escallonia rubra TaxID=112253 RepID=A0AA88RGA9_9ASTE|nr:hypothetical protein RJ640_018893 [Escallonia rubra]
MEAFIKATLFGMGPCNSLQDMSIDDKDMASKVFGMPPESSLRERFSLSKLCSLLIADVSQAFGDWTSEPIVVYSEILKLSTLANSFWQMAIKLEWDQKVNYYRDVEDLGSSNCLMMLGLNQKVHVHIDFDKVNEVSHFWWNGTRKHIIVKIQTSQVAQTAQGSRNWTLQMIGIQGKFNPITLPSALQETPYHVQGVEELLALLGRDHKVSLEVFSRLAFHLRRAPTSSEEAEATWGEEKVLATIVGSICGGCIDDAAILVVVVGNQLW